MLADHSERDFIRNERDVATGERDHVGFEALFAAKQHRRAEKIALFERSQAGTLTAIGGGATGDNNPDPAFGTVGRVYLFAFFKSLPFKINIFRSDRFAIE